MSTYRVGDYVRALIDQETGEIVGFRTPADEDQILALSSVTQAAVIAALGYTPENAGKKGAGNGYASLDGTGRVPASQLPILGTYLGPWNASTNTPTLTAVQAVAAGSYRFVTVAGTQNIGEGSTTFGVGDVVVYNGSTAWNRVALATASSASATSLAPIDEFDATDVQAAIEELVDEKAEKAAPIFLDEPGGATVMRITAAGNVGVGSSIPSGLYGKLGVLGTGAQSAYVQSLDAGGVIVQMTADTDVAGEIGTVSNHELRIKTNGAVAITVRDDQVVEVPDLWLDVPGPGARTDQTVNGQLIKTIYTDNYDSIQEALDYAQSLGYSIEVVVPAGVNTVSGAITVPGNVHLRGENYWLSRIFSTDLDAPILVIPDGAANVRISNLFLDYSGGTPTLGADAIQVINAQTCVFDTIFVNGSFNAIAFRPNGSNARGGNHFITNLYAYNYVNAGFWNWRTIDIFVSNFRFACLGSSTFGAAGGIYLLGNCEANCFVNGDITTGDYSIKTVKDDLNARSRVNSPYFNRLVGVFFDSARNGSELRDLAHTDFIGCWVASAGYDQSLANPYANLLNVSGINLSRCEHIRFLGGEIYNNGGYGALLYSDNKHISFSQVSLRRNNQRPGGSGPAVQVLAPATYFYFDRCVFDPYEEDGTTLGGQTQSVNIQSGACDYYNVLGNTMVGCPFVDNGTGLNKFIEHNLGHNLPIYAGTYTPGGSTTSLSGGSTAATFTGNPSRYLVRDGICELWLDVIMDATNNGAGFVELDLPPPFFPSVAGNPPLYVGLWWSQSTGFTGIARITGGGATKVQLATFVNGYPGADSTRFIVHISYAI